MHKILTLLLLLCCTAVFSQTITLKGKITDSDNFPLESATIYLTSVKDSTMVDYTISNKNGNWELKIKKLEKPVFLKVSYVGLANHREQLENILLDRDFGTIKLADRSTELNEVVIENEIPPIRIKKDTLEFDAASFKVRPDANVETLLKQLPGVEIDDEGKIRVNGKEVSQILVNGKPFFDKDGKIALQNLPADIINKVQVSDTKTKQEEYTGKDASGNNASINLTIDEEKNKGFFGRFLGGYGSDKRYESSALINYFKGSQKISVLASSNNINTSGFTMDEIFDSMSGGRNNSIYTSSDGSFGINNMQFGGNTGITRSNIFGATYSDEWFKGFNPNINYFYTAADTENNNKSRSQSFLSDTKETDVNKVLITESSSRTDSEKYSHNFGTEFEFKIDSTSTLYFNPKFVKANSKVSNRSESVTRNQDDTLLNNSSGSTFDENDNDSFSANLNYSKSLNKKGRSISIDMDTENRIEDESSYNNTGTYFYDPVTGDEIKSDVRNQLQKNKTTYDKYAVDLQFNEGLSDSLSVTIGAMYSKELNSRNRDGFNFNEFTNDYTNIADALTNYLRGDETRITPYAGFNISKSKLYVGLSGGTSVINYGTFGTYLGNNYNVNKNYLLPYANGYINYRLDKSKYIYANYGYDVGMPSVEQLLPIADVSSTLVVITGNENLSPRKTHNIYVGYGNYDYASKSGYSVYVGGNFQESFISRFTSIDKSGKQFVEYGNLSGTYYTYMGLQWSKTIKTEGAHKYRINATINGGLNKDKGITNGAMYEAMTYRFDPKVGLTYEYGELLTISPIYSFDYSETHYKNSNTNFQSRFIHKAGLQTTSYWPKNIVFGNDLTYTYSSSLGEGFKRDFFLWNTSLGYNFLNNKAMFKVKVYDMLNQNLGNTRSIGSNTISDNQNTVLKRYVMFSLSLKIDNFGKKKENNDEQRRFWQF